MGVTRFVISGVGISANYGAVQRWSYDDDLRKFTYVNSLTSAINTGMVFGNSSYHVIEDPVTYDIYVRNETVPRIFRSLGSVWSAVTGWGSGGYVSCPAGPTDGQSMAANSAGQLFACSQVVATTSTVAYSWTSTGAVKWVAVATVVIDGNSVAFTSNNVYVSPDSGGKGVLLKQSDGSVVLAHTSTAGFTYSLTNATGSLCYGIHNTNDRISKAAISTGTPIVSATNFIGSAARAALLHTNGYYYISGSPIASVGRVVRYDASTLSAVIQSVLSDDATGGTCFGIGQSSAGLIFTTAQARSDNNTCYIYALSANLTVDAVSSAFPFFQPYGLVVQAPYSVSTTLQAPETKQYSRRIVAIAQNKLWYENASGEIVSLAVSLSALDCTKGLTACEAYQKVFVANTSVLAVADFSSAKLYTQTIGVLPARGTIITGSASGAEMVVDLATDAAGTCEVYGTRYTTATFLSTDTCANAALSVSFALAAPETAGPHWYNWPVYASSATYGILPVYANLVALYRGRLVLAGNPQYPYQWYMSRVANPWDFEYTAGDPLTAIAGSNADAGQLGDIIRALIPYSPDFMIFGCANSMWLLNGDPAAGGSLDEITKDTGIYGPRSWCKDDKGDLYFFGTYGLYHMAGGRGQPSNILSAVWPNLIEDWGLNPSNHRVVMEYDVQRAGVVVCMTNVDDGSNKAFFYHVPTGSVFPETYHTECAPYSMCAYPSDDAETKGLILGCQDAYLRHFEDGATEDVGSVTTAAVISAYVGWVEKLTEDEDTNMKLNWLFVETGGAISGDTQTDTTSVNMSLYAADDAETCMQKMAVGTVAFLSTSFSGNGRQNKFRQRIKTPYLGVQFATSSVAAYWTINKVVGDVEPSGGIR